jgi:protein-tyrosine-phosphatase
MAAGIARTVAAERGLTDVVIDSAGAGANPFPPGVPMPVIGASDGALLVALEHGIDLGGHRAQPLTRDLVEDADLVLAMGERHLARVAELGGAGKAFLLTDFASHGERARGVADPFGGDLAAYRATFAELDHEVRRALDRLVPSGAGGEG